jgi:hypothetical protein
VCPPHLETLVQNRGSIQQTAKRIAEDSYGCVHHQEADKVAGKLPQLQMWGEKVVEEQYTVEDAHDDAPANTSLL